MRSTLAAFLLSSVVTGLWGLSPAQGAIITYSEATSGDLAGILSAAPLLTSSPLAYGDTLNVVGTLNSMSGRGPDDQDSFKFTVSSQARISISSLVLNTAPGLGIFFYSEPGDVLLDARTFFQAFGGQGIFGIVGPGTYGLSLVPGSNNGSLSYTIQVDAVPEPSSLALCGVAGIAGALLGSRRWLARV